MNKILSIISGVGLLLGLTFHIMSILDIYIESPIPVILHIGFILILIPIFLAVKDDIEIEKNKKHRNPMQFYNILFAKMPKPIMVLALLSIIYWVINFLLCMQMSPGGTVTIIDGEYVISNRGTIIKELTEKEYFSTKALGIRKESAHWILVYTFAMGILWSKKDKKITLKR